MPSRGVSLAQFSQICRVCTAFQNALAVKISLDLLKSNGGLKLTGSGWVVTPKFSAPPSGETMRQTPKSIRGARTCSRVLYHHAKFGGAQISPAVGAAKNVEFFCLFVCSSCFWMSEFVRPISPWRRWRTKTILMPLDRGSFVVVHSCSTFSACCQTATPLNALVQIMAKIGVFLPTEGDRMNSSRRNLAR